MLALLAVTSLTSCSHTKPAPPMKHGTAAQLEGSSSFGGEVVVNDATATATVVSIDTAKREIVLKRPDGRLARCVARPGPIVIDGIKVGDQVSIGLSQELALAVGKSGLPEGAAPDPGLIRVRVPEGLKAVAEAVEIISISGKVMAKDDWNDTITLGLAGGESRTLRVPETVNIADLNVGDAVTARITDTVVLIVK